MFSTPLGQARLAKILDFEEKGYVDNSKQAVLEFTNDHRHGPMSVPSVEPVAAVVEYPKGYRKFREV